MIYLTLIFRRNDVVFTLIVRSALISLFQAAILLTIRYFYSDDHVDVDLYHDPDHGPDLDLNLDPDPDLDLDLDLDLYIDHLGLGLGLDCRLLIVNFVDDIISSRKYHYFIIDFFLRESYGGGIDDVSTEDEDDNSGEV